MEGLEERLGYTFRNRKLLKQALTHPSLSAEKKGESENNQRLEFLGDAVLQLVLTEYLYRVLPDDGEGRLTQLRASVVSRPALAACARRLELGPCLRLGRGEDGNQGRERDSNLADAFEAVLGALHLDGGMEASQEVLMRLMQDTLEQALEGEDASNPKGKLQELLQAIDGESPVYRVVGEDGPDHQKEFIMEVLWGGRVLAVGAGASKKSAETAAAETALKDRAWEK